ncbi:MAG TPA: GNAT family N-acetyltransferase [Acidimicrobiales bacterium]|nr:GNAT family N-acetyltransferase [Acidimicrobiales bacterium]
MDPLVPTRVETERLILRRPEEADVDALLPLFDAEVVRYLSGEVPDRPEMWRAVATMLGHWEMRGYGMFVWEERGTGAVVGRGGLWYPAGWPQLEVGWMLGRAWWGRGYATEAGRAALALGWGHLAPPWMCSVIRPGNEPSMAVARRLGGRRAGHTEVRGFDVEIWRYDSGR